MHISLKLYDAAFNLKIKYNYLSLPTTDSCPITLVPPKVLKSYFWLPILAVRTKQLVPPSNITMKCTTLARLLPLFPGSFCSAIVSQQIDPAPCPWTHREARLSLRFSLLIGLGRNRDTIHSFFCSLNSGRSGWPIPLTKRSVSLIAVGM